jgi:hypothetical protein
MSCLNCVSAHRRGRLWFCNRCGSLMQLRPVSARVLPPARRLPERAPGTASPTRSRPTSVPPETAERRQPWGSLHGSLAAHPSARRHNVVAPLRSLDPGHDSEAVVLDLDEARRTKGGRQH